MIFFLILCLVPEKTRSKEKKIIFDSFKVAKEGKKLSLKIYFLEFEHFRTSERIEPYTSLWIIHNCDLKGYVE